jgi:hypothetical protein
LKEALKNDYSSFMTSLKYKPAKLNFANMDTSKRWYVYYWYLIPGTNTYKRFRDYADINRIHDAKRRFEYGKNLERCINQNVKAGFNPFETFSMTEQLTMEQQLEMIIEEQTRGATNIRLSHSMNILTVLKNSLPQVQNITHLLK